MTDPENRETSSPSEPAFRLTEVDLRLDQIPNEPTLALLELAIRDERHHPEGTRLSVALDRRRAARLAAYLLQELDETFYHLLESATREKFDDLASEMAMDHRPEI